MSWLCLRPGWGQAEAVPYPQVPTSHLLPSGTQQLKFSLSLPWKSHFHLAFSLNAGLNAYSLGDKDEQPSWNTFHTYTKNLGHHWLIFSNLGHVTQDVGSWGTSAPKPSSLTISCIHRRQGSRNRHVTHCLPNACRTLSLRVINNSKTGVWLKWPQSHLKPKKAQIITDMPVLLWCFQILSWDPKCRVLDSMKASPLFPTLPSDQFHHLQNSEAEPQLKIWKWDACSY